MRIIVFVLDPPVIERILRHIGEATEASALLPVLRRVAAADGGVCPKRRD